MIENPMPTARRIEIVALACAASVAITLATGLPIVRIVAREDASPSGDDGSDGLGDPARSTRTAPGRGLPRSAS